MSRSLICLAIVALLFVQVGCATRLRAPQPYKPAIHRDFKLQTIHHQPRSDGYVIVYPLN